MRAFVKIYRRKNKAKNRLISALLALAVLFSSAAAGTWLIAGAAETDNFTRNIEWVDEANGIAKVTVNVQAAADGNTSTGGGNRVIDFEDGDVSMVSSVGWTGGYSHDSTSSYANSLKIWGPVGNDFSISKYIKIDLGDTTGVTDITIDTVREATDTSKTCGFGILLSNGNMYWRSQWNNDETFFKK